MVLGFHTSMHFGCVARVESAAAPNLSGAVVVQGIKNGCYPYLPHRIFKKMSRRKFYHGKWDVGLESTVGLNSEVLNPTFILLFLIQTQLRLEAFYTFNERFAKVRSQRIKKALKGITGTLSSDLTDELVKEGPSSRKKRCTGLSTGEEYKPENSTDGNSKRGKKVLRQSKGPKAEKEFIFSEDLAGESSHILEKDGIDDTSVLSLNRTGKGRRGRGRGARGRGKGRGRSSPIKADSDSTDDGDDYNANVQLDNHSKVPE
ncbi:hypothetical protein BHE74_00015295, partial [Ensete ventricosum]